MKYELEPENRNCPDDVLLNDLSAVAKRLGKSSLTKEDYNKHGRFSAATMQNRFGSWNKALERSGLRVQKRVGIPREEMIEDLRRVAKSIGATSLSRERYRQHGKFSEAPLARAFGSWGKAVMAADLSASPGWNPQVSDEDLFGNMAAVWETVGRQPKLIDFHPPVSKYSHGPYIRRFGSWRNSLEAFVAAMNDDSPQPVGNVLPKVEAPAASPPQAGRRGTPRAPGWRLKFLVHRRDRFSCRACGKTPALEPGLELQLDHILAWSKGGETTYENLQTLCKPCNIGKGNLPMSEEGTV